MLAVIISLLSLLLAIIALGWNVYEKVALRPRLQVAASMDCVLFSESLRTPGHYLSADATNLGPGEIVVCALDIGLAYGGGFWVEQDFPKRLQVGDHVHLDVSLELDAPAYSQGFDRIGFRDSFGRRHCLSAKSLKEINQHVEEARQGVLDPFLTQPLDG